MHVVISKFEVANGMEAEVLEAFQNRPHAVDNEPGFVRMEVLRPQDQPKEFWLLTHWETEQDWQRWYHSHQYKDSHKGMPKGLRLVPKATEIRGFESVAN